MKKILSSLSLVFTFPIRLLKRTRIDNFVGGLIFGALFALFVNILTVKIQEDIAKQRVLESLEKEITFHVITANSILDEADRINNLSEPQYRNEYIASDNILNSRLSTRAWETSEANKYLLEIDPNAAAKVEVYYSTIVRSLNHMFDSIESDYKELYKSCRPLYELISGNERKDPLYCNTITDNSVKLQVSLVDMIYDNVTDVKGVFHPTRDRLGNLWLKILLGNKSVEILK